jgi:hypothetical protein
MTIALASQVANVAPFGAGVIRDIVDHDDATTGVRFRRAHVAPVFTSNVRGAIEAVVSLVTGE